MTMTAKITATTARYIKLGDGGLGEQDALREGFLPLWYGFIPHEVAATGNAEAIARVAREIGRAPSTAADDARQVMDFYTLGENTLWITFVSGRMWWCFTRPEVIPHDGEGSRGFRYRWTRDGWHDCDVNGRPLHMAELNGGLTKKAMYRKTICDVYPDQRGYVLRKINGEAMPEVEAAQQARANIIDAIVALMQKLQPNDFEILVDLVFSQSGWRRLGAVGKTQDTIDMELELPSTGERAFIQVKSHTRQSELDHYIEAFTDRADARMFYVYHSARYGISTTHPQVTLIDPKRLADMVLGAGLFDWLLRKAG